MIQIHLSTYSRLLAVIEVHLAGPAFNFHPKVQSFRRERETEIQAPIVLLWVLCLRE